MPKPNLRLTTSGLVYMWHGKSLRWQLWGKIHRGRFYIKYDILDDPP